MKVEWDPAKAKRNLNKHDVAFEEAITVFADPLARIFVDEDEDDEMREIMVGHSIEDRLLLVCFTEREPEILRIISARRATRVERGDYEKGIWP